MKAFGNFHPLVLLIYYLSVMITAMFIWNPVLQGLALLGGVLFCMMLLRKRQIIRDVLFYVPMFLIIAVTNPLFSHNGITPLFFMNGNPVTLEAFFYGIAIAVMLVSVIQWCKCYNEIMTSDKFLYLFGKAIPKTALILSMAIRFIPLLKRQMKKVDLVQKTMGLYSSKSYMDKCRSKVRVLSAMITWSLENAMEVSASMRARGYGLKGRSCFSLFRFYKYDGLFLGISIFLSVIVLSGSLSGATEFFFYPEISSIKTTVLSLLAYLAYAVLVFLPFIIEVKENLKWNYYISKI